MSVSHVLVGQKNANVKKNDKKNANVKKYAQLIEANFSSRKFLKSNFKQLKVFYNVTSEQEPRTFFLVFDFCRFCVVRFCVVISFFSFPPQRPMNSDFKGFSIPDFIHYIYFPILILEKEPVFSLLNVQC